MAITEWQSQDRNESHSISVSAASAIYFSSLLELWVKGESQKTQLPLDVVIGGLSNRLGGGANVSEALLRFQKFLWVSSQRKSAVCVKFTPCRVKLLLQKTA